MSCHDPIPSTAKHLEAPYDDVYMTCYVMTPMTMTWTLDHWRTWRAKPARPINSFKAGQIRQIWFVTWHGLSWLGHGLAQTDTSAVWSCLIPFVHLNPSGSLLPVKIMFELFSNFMFMVLLRIWNYTSLSHHETIFCSLFLHLLSDQGPIFPFCFYHQDR